MSLCPSNCTDIELTSIVAPGCEIKERKRSLYKLGFFACNQSLPNPLTCDNLMALIQSNAVVFSNGLANVEWGAPEFEERVLVDCLPAQTRVVSRALNFQDRIAVDIPEGGSGSSAANPFADLKFWGNKQKLGLSLRYLFLWCDGTIDLGIDDNGKPMAASLNVYRSFESTGTGGSSYTLEVKQGAITFKGDPLALREDYEPALIVDGVECSELATLLGLSI